ncbi:MAG: hypothetical protein HY764_02195 [Candidatus Portnoybacteria bacterium]|nr:hypothetical protein [Candidatus Portnoybacteria bacterium]
MTREIKINGWREVIHTPILTLEIHPCYWTELEDILQRSIRKCAKVCYADNESKIFTTLSGGLDSSLCLALISWLTDINCRGIYTFTIAGNLHHPDRFFARKMALQSGTNHQEIVPTLEMVKVAEKKFKRVFPDLQIREGTIGVYMLYEFIHQFAPASIIVHDGIDELLGGYWDHRAPESEKDRLRAFQGRWTRLSEEHLIPLEKIAAHFGISLIFPYLQKEVVEYITGIPLEQRTSREMSKIPLRRIAAGHNIPKEIIERPKIGACDMLKVF